MGAKAAFQSDTDIHITLEDQQKINRFARQNAKWEELKDDLKGKQRDLQNLEDASDDLLVDDEAAPIPFVVGEVFINLPLEEAKEKLEEAKKKKKKKKRKGKKKKKKKKKKYSR